MQCRPWTGCTSSPIAARRRPCSYDVPDATGADRRLRRERITARKRGVSCIATYDRRFTGCNLIGRSHPVDDPRIFGSLRQELPTWAACDAEFREIGSAPGRSILLAPAALLTPLLAPLLADAAGSV